MHAAEQEHEQAEDQQHRQDHHQQPAEEGILCDLRVVLLGVGARNGVEHLRRHPSRVLGHDLLNPVLTIDGDGVLELEQQFLFAIVDLRLGDVLLVELLHGHGRVHVVVATGAVGEHAECVDHNEHRGHDAGDPQNLFLVHVS